MTFSTADRSFPTTKFSWIAFWLEHRLLRCNDGLSALNQGFCNAIDSKRGAPAKQNFTMFVKTGEKVITIEYSPWVAESLSSGLTTNKDFTRFWALVDTLSQYPSKNLYVPRLINLSCFFRSLLANGGSYIKNEGCKSTGSQKRFKIKQRKKRTHSLQARWK